MELCIIVAVSENGVIGKDGEMPWHVPGDLEHFRKTTDDHPVIMGRVTFEGILHSLGKPLPNRTNVVLTSRNINSDHDNVILVNNMEDAVEEAARAAVERHDGADRIFIAGGESVYEQFLPQTERLVITEIKEEYEGDAFFYVNENSWNCINRIGKENFTIFEYERVHGAR